VKLEIFFIMANVSKTLHISLYQNRSSTEISHCFRSSALHQDRFSSKTVETHVAIDCYWNLLKVLSS